MADIFVNQSRTAAPLTAGSLGGMMVPSAATNPMKASAPVATAVLQSASAFCRSALAPATSTFFAQPALVSASAATNAHMSFIDMRILLFQTPGRNEWWAHQDLNLGPGGYASHFGFRRPFRV